MSIKVGVCNLWLSFILGYGIIWVLMAWANKKRGKPIEDLEMYAVYSKKRMFLLGYLPATALFIGSIFVPVHFGIRFWVGVSIFVSGIILNVISMCSFARFTGGLNTTGIHRYSRNPMYVGGFLFILGLNLIGWSISLVNTIFIILSILWVVTTHWWVLQEEYFLETKYGNSFKKYKERVPRYIGIPWRIK